MKRIAMIMAAGQGRRMAAGCNKALLTLAGQPLLLSVLDLWRPLADQLLLVIAAADQAAVQTLAAAWDGPLRLVTGGANRAESVACGLAALSAETAPTETWLAVHDAARPLTLARDIEAVWQAATATGAAILAAPVVDTIRRQHNDTEAGAVLPRQQLLSVQTPQVFRLDILRSAYAAADATARAAATDDAALVQNLGRQVNYVWASGANFKLTHPEDLALAEAVLAARRA